jgi:hypothetical protein
MNSRRERADFRTLGWMTRIVRDVLGSPESWPNYRSGAWHMPLLRGATVVSALEAEPNELRLAIDARGHILHSTFVVEDRDLRHRILEILQPGAELADCLSQAL